MAAQVASKKVYQQHRERQRAMILDAARELFIEKGIGATTLGEIAEAVGVTRATIYQYFANQAEIARAILEASFQELQEAAAHSPLWRGELSGYEQLASLLSSFQDGFASHPESFRFLAQIDVMCARSQDVERLLATGNRIFGCAVEPVVQIIRHGQEDGSLRTDLDPVLTAAVVINVLLSLAVRTEAHRQSITIEYHHTPDQILATTSHLLLESMRAPQAVP